MGELAVIARMIRDGVRVPEAAGWFGFDYGLRQAAYPCPMCEAESTTRKTLKLYDEGVRWQCFRCDTGGDVIDWIAARMNTTKGFAIELLADRLDLTGSPQTILDQIRRDLVGMGARLTEIGAGAAREAAIRRAFWKWRARVEANAGTGPADWRAIPGVYAQKLLAWEILDRRADDAAVLAAKRWAESGQTGSVTGSEIVASLSVLAHFYANKLGQAGVYARYARARGLNTEAILRAFTIGACPRHGTDWPKSRVMSETKRMRALEASGAVRRSKRYEGTRSGILWEMMRGRLVFPIRDIAGRTVALAGRLVEGTGPKYLNTPASPVYSKAHTLYNLDRALPSAMRRGWAILGEGYTDAIAYARAGIPTAVSACGTAFTAAHAEALSRVLGPGGTVLIGMDADGPGRVSARRSAALIAGARLKPRLLPLPPGLDPDEALGVLGGPGLRGLVRGALMANDGGLARIRADLGEAPVFAPRKQNVKNKPRRVASR